MNPFSYGMVVRGSYFFDREKEMARIVKTLSGGNNLVLCAPRRYGKTSLVVKSIEELEQNGFRCIYFDFMAVYSKESFVESYTRAVMDSQNNLKQALSSLSKHLRGIKASLSLDKQGVPSISIEFSEAQISDSTLSTLVDLPSKLASSGQPYIVVMDEFQDICKLNGDNFEDTLRSKIQHHQNVNYLFLGSQTHLLNDMFTNKNRPFYKSASTMKIGPLPLDETIDFLQERFSRTDIVIDRDTAEYLVKKSGQIPYYIQLLASEAWQTVIDNTKTVSTDIVDNCIENTLEHKFDFYFEIYDRQSAYKKKLLKALANDGSNIYSREYTREHRLSAVSTTQKAVKGLIDSGIIEKHDGDYLFNDPFFKMFVLRLKA